MLKEAVQGGELGEEVREGIGLVKVRVGGTVVEEGDREVEVGERNGCEGFDKDIDYDIRVVEILVELITLTRCKDSLVNAQNCGFETIAYSFKMARLARQSYSWLLIW